jgi:hypothetical protein
MQDESCGFHTGIIIIAGDEKRGNHQLIPLIVDLGSTILKWDVINYANPSSSIEWTSAFVKTSSRQVDAAGKNRRGREAPVVSNTGATQCVARVFIPAKMYKKNTAEGGCATLT